MDNLLIPQESLLNNKLPRPLVEKGNCGGIWQNLEDKIHSFDPKYSGFNFLQFNYLTSLFICPYQSPRPAQRFWSSFQVTLVVILSKNLVWYCPPNSVAPFYILSYTFNEKYKLCGKIFQYSDEIFDCQQNSSSPRNNFLCCPTLVIMTSQIKISWLQSKYDKSQIMV